MTQNIIATDTSKLSIDSGTIYLYEIQIGEATYRFCNEYDGASYDQPVIFDGKSYTVLPMAATGFEVTGEGAQVRPTLSMANVESLIKSSSAFGESFSFNDLIGARLTKRTTFEKYTGSGATAFELRKEVYIIDRITSRNKLQVQFELASPFDVQGVVLPNRVVTGKYCPWVYTGYGRNGDFTKSGCIWRDNNQKYDKDSNPTSVFFNEFDEPLINVDALADANYYKGTYSAATEYTWNHIVQYSGDYWRPKVASVQGVTPEKYSISWQLVRIFSVWNSTTSYIVNSSDFLKNSYVYEGNTVWRAVKANTNERPSNDLGSWVRADSCGKTLNSCRVRFQATLARPSPATHINAKPSGRLNTDTILPFGGFPGAEKFR